MKIDTEEQKPFSQPNYNQVTQGMAPFYTQPQVAQNFFYSQKSPIAQSVEQALSQTKSLLDNLEKLLSGNQNQQAMFQPQQQQQFIAQQLGVPQTYAYNNYQVNNQQQQQNGGFIPQQQQLGGFNQQMGINTNFQATY